MTFKSVILAAAACVSLATTAGAVTLSFVSPSPVLGSSLAFSAGGVGVEVTAGTFDFFPNPSTINFATRNVVQGNGGLGVNGGFLDFNSQVDGALGNDVLVFTFSQSVVLEAASFANVDSNDDFAFGTVVNGEFSRLVDFANVGTTLDLSSIATKAQRTGLSFGIGAIGFLDNFTVTGLNFSVAAQPAASINPSPVPLPASGLMLLGGLVLAGGIARRRRRAAR